MTRCPGSQSAIGVEANTPDGEMEQGRVFTICKCLWLFAWLDNKPLHFDTVGQEDFL